MKEEVINILTKRKKKEAKKKEKKNYYYCKLLAGQDIESSKQLEVSSAKETTSNLYATVRHRVSLRT